MLQSNEMIKLYPQSRSAIACTHLFVCHLMGMAEMHVRNNCVAGSYGMYTYATAARPRSQA